MAAASLANMKTKRTVGSTFRTNTSITKSTMKCSHCGRIMNNFAGGYSRGWNGEPLCHPNAKNRPDCYKLVTLYKHEMPCNSKTCYEDHEDFRTYVDVDDFSEPLSKTIEDLTEVVKPKRTRKKKNESGQSETS